MSELTKAVLTSWSPPPAASFALVLTAIIYLRGWLLMRRARVPFVPAWRAACFVGGLLTIWVALASPLDTFSAFLITAHMLQHMLLMMVAPPLILLGAPLIPLVRGLPVFAAREFAGPFLNWRFAIRLGNALTNLWVALILMGIVMFGWHTPRLYELALSSGAWHEFEHACFFVASLIFWWPVVQPWPSRSLQSRWAIVPYLLIADLQNTILAAILVFSDRLLYPSYAQMPRLFGLTALHDQAASGAIMWVMGSAAFLVPAVIIAVQCLSAGPRQNLPAAVARADEISARHSLLLGRKRLPWAFTTPKRETVAFVLLFAAAGLSLAWLASGPSDDDQVLRTRQPAGPFDIFLFSAPGELQVGANRISAIVQHRRSGELLPQAIVTLRAQRNGGSVGAEAVRANNAESENKLLQSAELDFPAPGRWLLGVSLHAGSAVTEVAVPFEVSTPERGLAVPWPNFVFLIFAAILLLSYLRRHRVRRTVASVPIAAPLQHQGRT